MRARVFYLTLAVVGCDSPFVAPPPTVGVTPPPDSVRTLVIRPDSATAFVDDTIVLVAIPRNGQGQALATPVTWSSRDTGVVTVFQTGVIIAADSGQAVIVAASEGISDSVTIRVTPVQYQLVSAGALHACAVGTNSRVYCWGSDFRGQLGVVPAVIERPAPTPVATGAGYTAVAGGDEHTCALQTTGGVLCWGSNLAGELGGGGKGGTGLPTLVSSSLTFRALALGGEHSCALTTASRVVCWGRNTSGELGLGDTASAASPQPLSLEENFRQISAGAQHTCGVTEDGTTVCWGDNSLGQLGDSTFTGSTVPDTVSSGGAFASVAAGGNHTCALAGGLAYCWGSNARGESGTGQPDTALVTPQGVTGSTHFSALTLGLNFTCGLGVDSLAYCWGANDRGQLGDATQTDRPGPVPVSLGLHFVMLAAGWMHVCALTSDGVIYCWGDGTSGQLGLAVPQPLKTVPTRIPFPP